MGVHTPSALLLWLGCRASRAALLWFELYITRTWEPKPSVCVSKKDILPARLTANYYAPGAVLMSTPVYAHPALLLPLLITDSIFMEEAMYSHSPIQHE